MRFCGIRKITRHVLIQIVFFCLFSVSPFAMRNFIPYTISLKTIVLFKDDLMLLIITLEIIRKLIKLCSFVHRSLLTVKELSLIVGHNFMFYYAMQASSLSEELYKELSLFWNRPVACKWRWPLSVHSLGVQQLIMSFQKPLCRYMIWDKVYRISEKNLYVCYKLEPQGPLIAHLSAMSTSVIS